MTAEPPRDSASAFWRRTLGRAGRREALFEELASLLQAGIGPRAAMDSLERTAHAPDPVVALWRRSIDDGDGFGAPLVQHPELVDPPDAALLRASERAGRLVDALRTASARIAEARRSRRLLLAKLAYPFLVLHVALLLPTLPLVAQRHGGVAWLSLVAAGLAVLWGVPVVLVTLWAKARTSPRGARRLAALPIAGAAIRAFDAARFASVLGMLHDAGERADVVLEEAGHAAGGRYLERLGGAVATVRDGGSLADAVALLPAAPRELRDLVSSGEHAGALSEHMGRAAALYEDRGRRAASRAATVLGALAFALAVLVVIATVIAVLAPIYGPLFDML